MLMWPLRRDDVTCRHHSPYSCVTWLVQQCSLVDDEASSKVKTDSENCRRDDISASVRSNRHRRLVTTYTNRQ